MGYRRLFIWVEGEDDVRFFERAIKPIFEKKYNWMKLIQHAQKPTKWKINFLKSIKAMNADYIYTTDINNAPCITAKKQEIQDKLRNIDEDRIIVVVKEIEGWYLGGLGSTESKKLRIPNFNTTDSVTKEHFDSLIPTKFDSRIDFMLEILKRFSIKMAEQKNKSFRYLIKRHDCEEKLDNA